VAARSSRCPGRAVARAGCSSRRRGRAVGLAGCNPRCPGRAAALPGCNPLRRARAVAGAARSSRRRDRAVGEVGCNPHPPGRAEALPGCNPRRRGRAVARTARSSRRRAVAPADCSSRCPGRVVAPAGCNPRRRGHAAAPAAARSPSRPVRAVASPRGSRSSHGLPGPFPPLAAVVAPQGGVPPPRCPRPPKHAATPQCAHRPSCRLAGQCPIPGESLQADPPIPRHPKPAGAGTAAPRLLRDHRGARHPNAPAHTLAPVLPVLRLPRVAGADKTAPQPLHRPNRAGVGKAAHRPPRALPGHSHRLGSARCPSPYVALLDVQRRHSAGPTTQIVPGTRPVPGRQGSGRNYVPPHPSHADRTSLPPRLPPPLPSGPSAYPHSVAQVTHRTALNPDPKPKTPGIQQ